MNKTDYIAPETAKTLPGLFQIRVNRSPTSLAYGYYDDDRDDWQIIDWQQFSQRVVDIQCALQKENLAKGDRVAIMLRNCPEWIMFDIAAMNLGLVTVPLYTNDRPDNVAFVINDAGVKFLLLQNLRQWKQLAENSSIKNSLQRVVYTDLTQSDDEHDSQIINLHIWSNSKTDTVKTDIAIQENDLATIVYTSGTTGKPKGVMLSHKNILTNAYAALQCGKFYSEDVFLSFLPLSHTLERTAGCFLPMMSNSSVFFARSIQQLAEDIKQVRPTIFVSVPRVYEMIYAKVINSLEEQSKIKQLIFKLAQNIGWCKFLHSSGKASWNISLMLWPLLNKLVADKINQRLGGRLRYAIAGGAALNNKITKFFISLNVPLYQGYGMTECSPVISVGRQDENDPFTIGKPLPGVEVKITENGELCTRSNCVMLGYYKNQQATDEIIDEQGWLHTGDVASMDEQGYLKITGRIKDIIVLASAEKISPQDMETAICADPLFEQAMVIGEGKPFLTALLVLKAMEWQKLTTKLGLEYNNEALRSISVQKYILKCLKGCLKEFPGYAQIRRVCLYLEPWSIENGLLTPTLKTKRPQVMQIFAKDINNMYESLAN